MSIRYLGAVDSEHIKPIAMQCPYGRGIVQLRKKWWHSEGQCTIANRVKGSWFKTSALLKAGCPNPERGCCKFRSGNWIRLE